MSRHWRDQRERGSTNALRVIIWLSLHCGRPLCRVLLVPITAYFCLTAPRVRRSSRDFVTRARARPSAWLDPFRHLFVFATTLLDRVYLVNGRQQELTVEVINEEAFLHALSAGRGCLLLGSHLGSFEMLSIVGSVEKKQRVNVVMHLKDDERVRALLSPDGHPPPYNIIPLGHPGSMMRVQECLERGEVVGILADRVYGGEATATMSFLGQPARFSLSPLRLAKLTGAPVIIAFALFCGGRRYQIVFEPLADLIGPIASGRVKDGVQAAGAFQRDLVSPVPAAQSKDDVRHARGESTLTVYLQSYVESLERHARHSPYNWFNFYDYWSA